jgi:lysine 2,3-aminomutase
MSRTPATRIRQRLQDLRLDVLAVARRHGATNLRIYGSIAKGQDLMRALRGDLSGLAMPTYVLDIPGGYGKVPVGPDYLAKVTVEDPWGGAHPYPPTD